MPRTRPTAAEEIEKKPGENLPPKTTEPLTEETPPHLPHYLPDGSPNPKAMTIWRYMQELEIEQWQHHVLYMWRTNPRMVRVAGQPGYLLCCSEALTLEDIRQRYGGKSFTLRLNRRGDKGKETTVYLERIAIEAPPNFQSGESPEENAHEKEKEKATAQSNEDLLRKLVDDVITQRDKATAEGRQFNPETALQNSLALFKKGSEAAIEMVTNQAEKTGSGEGMADKMIALFLPKLVEKLLAPAPDPLTQLSATAALLKDLQGEAPAAGDGPSNWKIALAQSLGGKADSILERIEKSFAHYARAQENRAAVVLAGRGFTVRTTAPGETPAADTSAPVQTSANPNPPLEPAPPTTPVMLEPTPDALAPTLSMPDFIKGKLVEMLFSGKEGDDAAIFAEVMDAPFAEQLARMMKENPQTLATDNILAQATRHPNVQKFCKDYVDYFEEEPPGAEVPPPSEPSE